MLLDPLNTIRIRSKKRSEQRTGVTPHYCGESSAKDRPDREGRGEVESTKNVWRRWKGGEHALDCICDSVGFVGSGIGHKLHDGWVHPCPAGDRHRRGAGPGYSRTKTIVAA